MPPPAHTNPTLLCPAACRLPFLEPLTRKLGVNAFILSYRGYGRSQGSPTERVRCTAFNTFCFRCCVCSQPLPPPAQQSLRPCAHSSLPACLPAGLLTIFLPLLCPCPSALLQGLQLDAEAALDHVLRRTDIDPQRVILFGRSLGGAVATYAACHSQPHISGLILENTFSRVVDLVPHMLPFLRLLVGPGRWARLRSVGRGRCCGWWG